MQQSPIQTAEARLLRQNLVLAEQALWGALRNRGFRDLKFRRQAPVGPHIVDFLCVAQRLILEIDSLSPPARLAWFAAQGYTVFRLRPQDILSNLPGSLQHLAEELDL